MAGKGKLLPCALSACLAGLLICAGAPPSPAASPFGADVAGEDGAAAHAAATKSAGPSPEEQKTARDIEAAFTSGDYDEAIALAKNFVRSAESGPLKTRAARLVANSQRKKKEWGLAQGAYLSLRDRYEKGSDEYVRAGAIAEILRASPKGVYHPLAGASGGQAAKTLDDDAVLEEAMACLARNRAKRVELRLPRVKRTRTVQEVLQRFLPLAEEIRRLRVIWPEMSPSLERAAVQTAAMRLAPLSKKALAALREKDAYYKAILKKRGANSSRQSEMLQYKAMCENLAASEESFLGTMDQLAGTSDWPEGQTLRQESEKRRDAYVKLAEALMPPKRDDRGSSGGYDWRGRSGDGDRW
ncbi:MAG: hypothetical protein U9R68_05920 [Planctomycetota bacterium]|nr:hypothetical protein [Planctomycetota bacterium]